MAAPGAKGQSPRWREGKGRATAVCQGRNAQPRPPQNGNSLCASRDAWNDLIESQTPGHTADTQQIPDTSIVVTAAVDHQPLMPAGKLFTSK